MTASKTHLVLLEAAMSAAMHAWSNSAREREKIRELHDAEAQGEPTETITMRISTRESVYWFIALDTIRRGEFSSKDTDQLEPSNLSDWMDAWPILDNPKIAERLAKLGDQFPNFFCWVLSVDYIRRLLLKIRGETPRAEG
jgi:HAMP domain-containing protein